MKSCRVFCSIGRRAGSPAAGPADRPDGGAIGRRKRAGGFDALRRSLGVDSLDVTSGESGGLAVGASRYVNRNVRIGVKAGANPRDTGVGVDVDVTRRIKLRGQVGADGSTSLGAAAEWEY